jgi:hypothetical protein
MSGSESTPALSNTATFTLQCSGSGGSASDQVTVTVAPGGGGGGGGDSATEDSGGGSLDLLWLSLGSMLMVLRVRRRYFAGAACAS